MIFGVRNDEVRRDGVDIGPTGDIDRRFGYMALNGRFEFPEAAAVDLIRVAPFDMGLTVERAEGVVVFLTSSLLNI